MKSSALVIGAGYGGLLTANRLAARGHRVTLVNERAEFVDRIRLHEYVAGTRDHATRPLATMLHHAVRFVQGRATRIHPGRTPAATLSDGSTHAADHLVLAVGSGAGLGPAGLDGATALRRQLHALPAGARVLINGAGLTGIETATEIATAHPALRVLLHDPAGPLPTSSLRNRDWLRQRLPRLGVDLTDQQAEADLTIDCTGFRVPALAAESGLPVDAHGRVLLDDTLAVRGHDNLWGVGDAAVMASRPLRMACAVAEPMGGHVADGIGRYAAGQPVRPFNFGFGLQCVSLGRDDAMIVFVHRDDRPTTARLTGRAGAWFKELVSTAAVVFPARFAQGYVWLGAPKRRPGRPAAIGAPA
ncbi:NAD(P)/FAD-dependent oxidoreductase [Granulicoccus sp. GXG6511]|uniref:NAD(P)/FAD-dependent oxidoreductase n=1 Tax=Granulicoccus sp. GXG6511 TaxID=3381351 RepID=UPI003D7E1B31